MRQTIKTKKEINPFKISRLYRIARIFLLEYCKKKGLIFDYIISPNRSTEVCRLRQLFGYELRNRFKLTFKETGHLLRRDYSTIMAGIRKLEAGLIADEKYNNSQFIDYKIIYKELEDAIDQFFKKHKVKLSCHAYGVCERNCVFKNNAKNYMKKVQTWFYGEPKRHCKYFIEAGNEK